jgi:serine/threonine protein kinase
MIEEQVLQNKTDWQKLNELFAAASALETAAQNDFLEKISDAGLRRKVKRMLKAAQKAEANGFLEDNAFPIGARIISNDEEIVEKQIGKYRIIREIGRGGMGTIYLAEREDFHHRVALKIIKRGMDTDEIIRRFEHEREVLATLSHPNIARLLDGGTTDDGLPFLVMEFVEGSTITEFCEENSLNIEERLELFRKVCSAVAYSHQNLIVHRDLKPSNILVDKEGEPKLLDFGIAKLLAPDRAGQTTETGFRLLTPEYASPEQIRGERVTTASDIYSLGVLLYELLTGQKPYEITSRNAAEIIRVVCETAPERPSFVVSRFVEKTRGNNYLTKNNARLTKSLKGDLDNIILKALRKEIAQRYFSVEQFAEDIRRYLTGLPIIARRATFGYQFAKFIERNRTRVVFSSIALIALLAGLSIAIWQASIARQERARAEQRFNEVRKLANHLVDGWDRDIPESLVSNQVRGRIADISTEYLDNLAQETDDPSLLKELAKAYITVGHEYTYQFIYEEKARSSLRKAEAITRGLISDAPADVEAKRLLAECLEQYDGYFGERDRAESLKNRLEIIRLDEEILAANPDDLRAMFDLSNAYALYGLVLKTVGRRDEAIEFYARATEGRKRRVEVLEKNATTPDDRAKLSSTYVYLAGDQANSLKEFQAATDNLRRAGAIADALFTLNPESESAIFAAVTAHYELGLVLKKTSDISGSLEAFRKSLNFARVFNARSPSNSYFVRKEYDCLMEIAEALYELGESGGALAALRESLELRRKWTERDKDNFRTYAGHAHLFSAGGKLLLRMKRFDEALAAYQEAERGFQKVLEGEPDTIGNRRGLATLYLRMGDFYAGSGVCGSERSQAYGGIGAYEYCPPDANETTTNRARLQQAQNYYQKAVDIFGGFETQSVAQYDDKENLRIGKEKTETCAKKLNGRS